MATAIMKQKEVPETDDVEEIISKISEESPYKRRPTQKRTWMTVPEMGKLLGLKKTDRYWLVHKNVFESKEIAGKIRINIASFEKWYANQIKYHKVTGEEPGKELKSWSYSVKEVADLLGVDEYLVYDLLKKNQMEAVIVDYWKRIPKESFQNWYKSQSRYRTKEDREKDILLILDEIQCGMGRTGYMYAWQRYGIKPDIMTSAKALGCGVPVGAFMMTEKVAQNSLTSGDHGSTYGGNPLACAAVSKVIDLFEEENILDNVKEVGEYLAGKLDELVLKYDFVKEHRGLGLLQGLECDKPVAGIINKALDKGLLLINAGTHVIRFIPALTISKENVDEMITILDACLAEAE
jgi:excisionase family DNA binding protein